MKAFAALPGGTSASVVIGLQSQSSQKWKLFLNGGPYWNYIARFVVRKGFFRGNDTRVDDVVNTTIARVARSLASGRFVYKAAGKGYFRSFLKMVATHVAFDTIRKERRCFAEPGRKNASPARDMLLASEADSRSDTRKLDAYDSSAAVMSDPRGGGRVHLVSIEDIKGVFDDGDEGALDPASMHRYDEERSREELKFLRRVQKNVFSLALVSVLSDESIPVARREMLNMLYVGRMSPADIYALDEFRTLRRGTFDKKVFDARQSLVKPILSFWKAVSPKSCENSDEELRKLWCSVLGKSSTNRLAKATLKRLKDSGDMPEGVKV